jgi:hypothetical protein
MRLSARLAWEVAKVLVSLPQTPAVEWWTAALLRFASTGQTLRVRVPSARDQFFRILNMEQRSGDETL